MDFKEAKLRILNHVRVHGIGMPPHIHIGEALELATILLDKMDKGELAPVVYGEWIGEPGEYICSRCRSESPNDGYDPSQYCPECGAKMNRDGIDDERFWYPCVFDNDQLLHKGAIVDGTWYELLDRNGNKEAALIKLGFGSGDHLIPKTDIIKKEDIIAYRKLKIYSLD